MGFTASNTLPLLLLLSFILFGVIVSTLILSYRACNNAPRSCVLAAVIFTIESLGLTMILLNSIMGPNIEGQFVKILDPDHLIIGYAMLFPLIAYSMEIKRPGWLNLKRCFLLAVPAVAVSLLLVLAPENYTKLNSIEDIYFNGDKTDVLLRIILGLLYILYGTASVLVPYEQKKTGLPQLVADTNQVLIAIVPFTFLLGMNLNIFPAIILHTFLLIAIDISILYTELMVRIPANVDAIPEKPTPQKSAHPYFDNPEIWMDPEMTAVELSRIMGTNQKYLSAQIKECGYSGFKDMINHKRVEYICEKLSDTKGERADIIQLMYDAGFRSRSNASSEFKRITGCTPSEYQKKFA